MAITRDLFPGISRIQAKSNPHTSIALTFVIQITHAMDMFHARGYF